MPLCKICKKFKPAVCFEDHSYSKQIRDEMLSKADERNQVQGIVRRVQNRRKQAEKSIKGVVLDNLTIDFEAETIEVFDHEKVRTR